MFGILAMPFITALIYKPEPPTIMGTFLICFALFRVNFKSANQSATE